MTESASEVSTGGPKRRVLFVSSLWPPTVLGGSELYAADLARRLSAEGHEVGVVTFGVDAPDVVAAARPWPYRLDQYADASRMRRLAFHALDVYRPDSHRVLRNAIRSFAPDVVHSRGVYGLSSAALFVPASMGVAHVHSIPDYWLLCQRSTLMRKDGEQCTQRCTGCRAVTSVRNRLIGRHPPHVFLSTTRALADEHASLDWVADRVRVVPHPVEWADRSVARPGPHPPVFGYLGQLVEAKGVRTLVRAFRDAAIPGARLVIAGDGPLRGFLESEAGDGVEVVGWLDKDGKRRFFDTIDCLVVPSTWKEPAGRVILEARAFGIPVIAARVGGMPEYVSSACTELLFEPGDAAQLAHRMQLLATDIDRFAVDDRHGTLTWAEHLAAVHAAYDDAMRLAAR